MTTVIKTSVGRAKAERLRQVSRSTVVEIRSAAYATTGFVSIATGLILGWFLVGLLRCDGNSCRAPGEVTYVSALFSILPGILGWHNLLYSRLKVSSWGLESRSPLVSASIAWADLEEAYVNSNGMSLRLRTSGFTTGVYPIQVSNWETWFGDRENRAEAWAREINAVRDRMLAGEAADVAGKDSPVRRFRIRVLPWALTVLPWAVAVALFHPSLGNL